MIGRFTAHPIDDEVAWIHVGIESRTFSCGDSLEVYGVGRFLECVRLRIRQLAPRKLDARLALRTLKHQRSRGAERRRDLARCRRDFEMIRSNFSDVIAARDSDIIQTNRQVHFDRSALATNSCRSCVPDQCLFGVVNAHDGIERGKPVRLASDLSNAALPIETEYICFFRPLDGSVDGQLALRA